MYLSQYEQLCKASLSTEHARAVLQDADEAVMCQFSEQFRKLLLSTDATLSAHFSAIVLDE